MLGESPVWDPSKRALYWVDIKGLKLHRFTPATKERSSWCTNEPIGCIDVPDPSGKLLAATRSGFAWLLPRDDGRILRLPIISPKVEICPGDRFNDGKRAPDGSFWAGTMDDAEKADTGAWWRLNPATGQATRIDVGYRVTNGPAFDITRERVYVTDSARKTVFVGDFHPASVASLKNKRKFLQFGEADGSPDGMQVFSDGSLWVAFWDGACLRRFSPDGEFIQQIDLPVRRPTSLAFAPEIDAVFVTSAAIGLNREVEGSLLRFNLV